MHIYRNVSVKLQTVCPNWAVPVFTAHTFPRTEAPGRRTSHKQVSGLRRQPPRGKQKEPSQSQELYQEPAPGLPHLRVQEHFPTVWPRAATPPRYGWIGPFTGKCTGVSFLYWHPPTLHLSRQTSPFPLLMSQVQMIVFYTMALNQAAKNKNQKLVVKQIVCICVAICVNGII